MTLLLRGMVALGVSGILIACSVSDDPTTEDSSTTSDAITAPTSGAGKLLYEGTCEFLHDCSSYSKKLPAGGVAWGCGNATTCDDDELWVAGPTSAQCGKHVKFCHGSQCAVALVKDVSVSHSWEGSNGLLDAIGLDHALTGKCSGNGGGSVTITPTTAAVTSPKQSDSSDDDDDASK